MRMVIRAHAPPGVRRTCLGTVLPPCRPPQRRTVKARGVHSRYNDTMAEREVEYIYDDDAAFEEDESDEDEEQASGMRDGLPPGAQKLLLAVTQRMYTTPWLPDSYVGAVSVQRIEGKGWGLVATDSIPAGELLLVCLPLAFVTAATADAPPMAALMDKLRRGRFSFAARQAFEALYDGSNGSSDRAGASSGSDDSSGSGRDGRGGRDSRSRGSRGGRDGSGGMDGRGDTGARRQPRLAELVRATARGRPTDGRLGSKLQLQLPEERLEQIVALNAFGDHCQDPAVATCRGEQLQGLLGIWPAYALINHSCLPNASPVIVGLGSGDSEGGLAAAGIPRLLVRATRDIMPGEEVCVSYLGREVLAPLGFRREELLGSYGFACRCPRCRGEASLGDGMAELLENLHEAAPELRYHAVQALEAKDTDSLRKVDAEVSSLLARLDKMVAEAGLAPMLASWIRTAAFDMYELSAACRMELDPQAYRSLRSLALVVELVGGALPGSDLHTLLAARFHSTIAARYGGGSGRTLEALQLCRQAHKLRYGPLDMAHMRTLTNASATVAATRGDGGGTQLLPPTPAATAAPEAGPGADMGAAADASSSATAATLQAGDSSAPINALAGAAGAPDVDAAAAFGGVIDEELFMRERLERLALLSGGEVVDASDPRAAELLQQEAAAQQERQRQQQRQQEEAQQAQQAKQQREKEQRLQQQQERVALLQLQLKQQEARAAKQAAAAAAGSSAIGSTSSSSSNGTASSSTGGSSSSSSSGASTGAADAAMGPPQVPAQDAQIASSSSADAGAPSAAAIAGAAMRKAKERRRRLASARLAALTAEGSTGAVTPVLPAERLATGPASGTDATAADNEAEEASTSGAGRDSKQAEEEGAGASGGLQPSQYTSLLDWMQHKDAAAAEGVAARTQKRGRGRPSAAATATAAAAAAAAAGPAGAVRRPVQEQG